MTINTERLKTDAAYWNECGAPEDATHYCPVSKLFYDDNYPIAPCCITRPTKPAAPEWVDGLPPVGCECEVSYAGYWVKATAVHVTVIGNVVFEMHGNYAGSVRVVDRAELVRTIHTPEQRQRERLQEIIFDAYESGVAVIAEDILSSYNLEPKP